jgi:hypothetical protein
MEGLKILINVINSDKPFEVCSSCHAENDLKEIIVGKTERQTITIRLCKNCREELVEKLNL